MFEIEFFNKIGQWQFPGLLFVVGNTAELFRVHAQFPGHLDMSVRKMVSLAGIDPSLLFLRYLFLFCHELVSSEAALPAQTRIMVC